MTNERRRTRAPLVTVAALGVLTAAVLAAIALWGSESEAFHLSPVPSYHVDIGDIPPTFLATSTGNSYVEDPNSDGDASDGLMSVPPITSCVSKTVDFSNITERFVITDIIIKNADEMAGAGVRINYDPSLITFVSGNITPFPGGGFTGQPVGLVNLPVEPFAGGTHRPASPAFGIDNTNGAVFLAGVYLGAREFDVSSESGPTVDSAVNSLPNRNAGQAPDGGVFLSIRWLLKPASSGQDVRIDLTVAGPSFAGGGVITGGSDFTHLISEEPGSTIQNVLLSSADLFDGVVSVNKAVPSPCPPPEPVHDVEAKHIGGAGGSIVKLFQGCNSDPCTLTQVHRLVVANNGDHSEDIRVQYQAIWPQVLIDAGCSANNVSASPIPLNDSTVTVNTNATHNVKVTVTYSCPAAAENAAGVIGATVTFILEAVHQRAGGDSQPDDDSVNDILTQGKILQ